MLVVAAVCDRAGYIEQPVAQCVYKNCILGLRQKMAAMTEHLHA